MVAVQCVSAAAEIIVIPVRSQHVVNVIVKAFEAEGSSKFVSLGSMVKYHIQDHFNPIVMKGFDKGLQFRSLTVIFVDRGVAGIGGKKLTVL